MGGSIIVENNGPVLIARLSRAENRNALDNEMKEALFDVATLYRDDERFRCLIITGSEDFFCAGGDMKGMTADRSAIAVRQRVMKTQAAARILTSCEKPVVTAVNGAAVGAGLSLALMGDIVIMSEKAYFMCGFPGVGVLPDLGLIYTLPRAVGMPRAKDIIMTNRRIDPDDALAMGLVSRVLPEDTFEAAVLKLAIKVAQGPTISLGLTKVLADAALRDSFEDFMLREATAQAVVFSCEDFVEGNAAFKERRAPEFRGR